MRDIFDKMMLYDDDELEYVESNEKREKENKEKGIPGSVPYLMIAAIMIWIAIIKFYPVSIWTIIITSMEFGSFLHIMLIILSFIHDRKVNLRRLVVPVLICFIGIGLFWARYYSNMEGINIILFR